MNTTLSERTKNDVCLILDVGRSYLNESFRSKFREDLMVSLRLPVETQIESSIIDALALFLRPTLSNPHRQLQKAVESELTGYSDPLETLSQIHNSPLDAWDYIAGGGSGSDTIISLGNKHEMFGAWGLYIAGGESAWTPEFDDCHYSTKEPPEVFFNGSMGTYVGWNIGVLVAIKKIDNYQRNILAPRHDQSNIDQDNKTDSQFKMLRILVAPWSD